ncbi:MAG: MBL fold metallo-hydrolase [Armatimonadota bacterium]
MEVVPVLDSTHAVITPGGTSILVGAPPEVLKLLIQGGVPRPSAVVLPPDPLFCYGINQASFDFLLYYHLFGPGGRRPRGPFTVVCDRGQLSRVETLVRHMLRGPSEAELIAWDTPPALRRQLLREMRLVSGETSLRPLAELAQVLPFQGERAQLPDGTSLLDLPTGEVEIRSGSDTVRVPRRAQRPTTLPLRFAELDRPLEGPRFGVQVLGGASGFCGSEWGSCFIVWIQGQPLVIDGTPYLEEHLRQLGLDAEQVLGYLITHNHEDHANALGALLSKHPVTLLTSGPVMAGLVPRLAAILGTAPAEIMRRLRWVPLHPGTEAPGEPLNFFGAELRTWYSVHTVPTLGVEITLAGKRIRLPGDTLWGRQLDPLLEQEILSAARFGLIQRSYGEADLIIADAGGPPIHPDPEEIHSLLGRSGQTRYLFTHLSETARQLLPPAEPGTAISLLPRPERVPEDLSGLIRSPLLREVSDRWLLALLYGGDILAPAEGEVDLPHGAVIPLAGELCVQDGSLSFRLGPGAVLIPELCGSARGVVRATCSRWTRLLLLPDALYEAFLAETGLEPRLSGALLDLRSESAVTPLPTTAGRPT